MATGDRYYENLALLGPSFRGKALSGNWVDLMGTGASADLPTHTGGWKVYNDYSTLSHVKFATVGSSENMVVSFQSYFTLDIEPSVGDLSLLDANPELIYELVLEDSLTTGLSFAKANVIHFISGTEGLEGGSNLYDLITTSSHAITSYTSAVRTNLENTPNGASRNRIESDASGRPIGVADAKSINHIQSQPLNTGFMLNMAKWSITEAVLGSLEVVDSSGVGTGVYLYRGELRMLRSDGTYKVNNDLKAYSPSVPTLDDIVVLPDTPLVGNADTIEQRIFKVKFNTDLTSDEEDTLIYDAFITEFGSVLLKDFADIVYDVNNIATEFNSLTGTVTTAGEIKATAYDGYGIADDIGDGSTTLKGLVAPFEAKFEFSNISDATSSVDTLVTNSPIQDGDNLVIVKDDDSIHELVASGVTDNSVDPDGSTNPTTDRYELWDNIVEFVPANGTSVYKSGSVYSTFWTPALNEAKGIVFDTPLAVNKCLIKRTTAGARRMPSSGDIEASHDGVTWVTLHSYASGNVATHMAVFNNGIAYRHYRLKCTANRSDDGYGTIDFIKAQGAPASMDTTDTTAGEIPSRVYAVDAQPSFAFGGYLEPDGAKNPSTIDAIPNMTSATVPYGVVTSKNVGHASYPEWKSANGIATGNLNRWLGSVAGGNWWQYEFVDPTIINKYILQDVDIDTTIMPRDWTFKASNTGVFGGEEVILDTNVGVTGWDNQTKVFTFVNSTAYKYYRIDITANGGSTGYYTVGEVAFVEATLAYDYIDAVKNSDTYSFVDEVDSTDPFNDGSLVAKYQFENDVTDSLDNHNLTGTLATYPSGQFGLAGLFNSKVLYSSTLTADTGTAFSMSFYINMHSIYGGGGHDTIYHANSFYLYITGNNQIGWMNGAAAVPNVTSPIPSDTWTRVTITYNPTGTETKLYIGSTLDYTYTGFAMVNSSTAHIGSRSNGSWKMLNSDLDQFEFFNRVLTQSDVDELDNISSFVTTRTYNILADGTSSLTLFPKVTLKNIGDKMTDMKFTVLGGA